MTAGGEGARSRKTVNSAVLHSSIGAIFWRWHARDNPEPSNIAPGVRNLNCALPNTTSHSTPE
eukprot:5516092-Alexandrium_andersonii.AAC.1